MSLFSHGHCEFMIVRILESDWILLMFSLTASS